MSEPRCCPCGAPLPPPRPRAFTPVVACPACVRRRQSEAAHACVRRCSDPTVPLPPSYLRVLAVVGDQATVSEVEGRTRYARSTALSMLERLAKRGDLRRLRPGVYARVT